MKNPLYRSKSYFSRQNLVKFRPKTKHWASYVNLLPCFIETGKLKASCMNMSVACATVQSVNMAM
jgi:hypothetical protein